MHTDRFLCTHSMYFQGTMQRIKGQQHTGVGQVRLFSTMWSAKGTKARSLCVAITVLHMRTVDILKMWGLFAVSICSTLLYLQYKRKCFSEFCNLVLWFFCTIKTFFIRVKGWIFWGNSRVSWWCMFWCAFFQLCLFGEWVLFIFFCQIVFDALRFDKRPLVIVQLSNHRQNLHSKHKLILCWTKSVSINFNQY